MHRMYQTIHDANLQKRIGLIPYLIPDFPGPEIYRSLLIHLGQLSYISGLKITFPCTDKFSVYTNASIRMAHLASSQFRLSWQDVLAELPASMPTICILYEQTIKMIGFENLLKETSAKIDGVLLDCADSDYDTYRRLCRNSGVGFIERVGPWMTDEEIDAQLAGSDANPVVNLMSAAMAGAPLIPESALKATIDVVKQVRPRAKIAASFGVQTVADVTRLANVPGIDAIIIGTALINKLRHGANAVQDYLEAIKPALSIASDPGRRSS